MSLPTDTAAQVSSRCPVGVLTDWQEEEEASVMREEEAKLKVKYPAVARPGPAFLQKRLQKGVRVRQAT